jgi:hypothetical protein
MTCKLGIFNLMRWGICKARARSVAMAEFTSYTGSGLRGYFRRFKGQWPLLNFVVERTRYSIAWIELLCGAAVHAIQGRTPRSSHQALVKLFMATGGRDHDRLARIVELLQPPYRLNGSSGVLGNLSQSDLVAIQSKLEAEGYCVFESCLSDEFCDGILQRSLEVECLVNGDEVAGREPIFERFNRGGPPSAVQFGVQRDDTTDIPGVQQLLCDESLIAVAQNYLRAKPIFTGISLGWSTAFKETPDDNAAQEFHWDMERIKWLRYFIYLTDVTSDNGPHCFIRGTHRTGSIPKELYGAGYVRHSDEEIRRFYGRERHCEFVGKRGTIIAEDSRGLHKGAMPKKGDRLLLAFELSSSTFGANKRHLIRNIHVPKFGEFAKEYPRLYANFDLEPGLKNSSDRH